MTAYHPHIHFVVAGGGVSEDGSRWLPSAAGFFFPEACASPIIRAEVRWLVWLFLGWTFWLASGHAPQEQPIERGGVRCAKCGGPMRIVDIVNVNCRALVEHSVAYLDSG